MILGSDDGDLLFRLGLKADVRHKQVIGGVPKLDVLEHYYNSTVMLNKHRL